MCHPISYDILGQDFSTDLKTSRPPAASVFIRDSTTITTIITIIIIIRTVLMIIKNCCYNCKISNDGNVTVKRRDKLYGLGVKRITVVAELAFRNGSVSAINH